MSVCKKHEFSNPCPECGRERVQRYRARRKAEDPQKFALERALSRQRCAESRKRYADRRRAKEPLSDAISKRVYRVNQRAKEMGVAGSIRTAQIHSLFVLQKGCCYDCGVKGYLRGSGSLHIGHGIPLSQFVSSNEIENILLQCKRCNSRQHNKVHPDFMRGFIVRLRSWIEVQEKIFGEGGYAIGTTQIAHQEVREKARPKGPFQKVAWDGAPEKGRETDQAWQKARCKAGPQAQVVRPL